MSSRSSRTHIISKAILLIFTLTIRVSSGGKPDNNNWALPQMVSMMHSQVLTSE